MSDPNALLLTANLRQLKLPTMLAEHDQLAREATARNEPYEAYLLRLTEVEVAARTANAITARIRSAAFPVAKELDTFDFTATPSVPKQVVLSLARGEWVEQRRNCCLIGGSGTGKTHLATAIGLSLCRAGKKVRFVTAAGLVRVFANLLIGALAFTNQAWSPSACSRRYSTACRSDHGSCPGSSTTGRPR